jgi:ribonuclease P protein component
MLPSRHRLKRKGFEQAYTKGDRYQGRYLKLKLNSYVSDQVSSCNSCVGNNYVGSNYLDSNWQLPINEPEISLDPETSPNSINVRIGIVISKKIAKRAVVRNRVRRQIRAILRSFLPSILLKDLLKVQLSKEDLINGDSAEEELGHYLKQENLGQESFVVVVTVISLKENPNFGQLKLDLVQLLVQAKFLEAKVLEEILHGN